MVYDLLYLRLTDRVVPDAWFRVRWRGSGEK
jgi:hypothetical protein